MGNGVRNTLSNGVPDKKLKLPAACKKRHERELSQKGHVMANQLDLTLQFHTDALKLRGQRQQLLASNIANADTPGYKARDLDFRKAMQEAAAESTFNVSMARTAQGHLASVAERDGATAGAAPALYRVPVQPSLDGNTVDMDVERASFADNAIHYEANLMILNSQLKSLLSAIQG